MKKDTTTKGPANLHEYQEKDINKLFVKLEDESRGHRLLYQLPTGGGKTIIFSEITRRFLEKFNRKVIILTHRIELCRQTSNTLKNFGIKNKVINSSQKRIKKDGIPCFVAMVETLNNRIEDGYLNTDEIGLVIIDEAHHNSFRKLIDKFGNASVIGVTATPLSSDPEQPMKENYDELIIGESIQSLIDQGFLAKPQYTKCLGNVTKNYREWLHNDYKSRLRTLIQKLRYRIESRKQIA